MIKFLKGVMKEHDPCITKWDNPTKRIFNGQEVQGRPTKGFGTSSFTYAGKLYKPTPWTTPMKITKMAAELIVYKELNQVVKFTFCLCGLYETGKVAIPHHSDTVPKQKDLVFSISFGASRLFEWNEYTQPIKKKTNTSKINRPHSDYIQQTTRYLVEHGDVFIFDGKSQMTSTHAVPTVFGVGERINLTFRTGL